ncbi:MAG TPA: hypothetical protein PKA63_06870 [Oligoflexia bacterium]|nr:hypothetical protein [Oligoflexia bacterium]HMP48372.1 hypothetical protein [Oligoflexia bacterium]
MLKPRFDFVSFLLLVSVIFFSTPLLIFVFGWLRLIPAIILFFLYLMVFVKYFRKENFTKNPAILSDSTETKFGIKFGNFEQVPVVFDLVFVLLLAFTLTYLSGVGGYAVQAGDWLKHTAIFNDLINIPWPVVYNSGNGLAEGQEFILVYYLGHYLPASLVAKFFPNYALALTYAIFVWTFLGISAGLFWFSHLTGCRVIWSSIFILFIGGLDIVGYYLIQGKIYQFGDYLEWWAKIHMQYSSFTSIWFWVPQHSLALLIGVPALIFSLKLRRFSAASLLCASLPLYSPFIVLGVLPFTLFFIFKSRPVFNELKLEMALLVIFLCLYVSYLGATSGSLGLHFTHIAWSYNFLKAFFLFHILEYGIYILIIGLARPWKFLQETEFVWKYLYLLVLLVLFFIPFIRSQVWNDWTMRVSLPALYLTWVFLLRSFKILFVERRFVLAAISVIVFSFGALSGLPDWHRAFSTVGIRPNNYWGAVSIVTMDNLPVRAQYLSSGNNNILNLIFRYNLLNKDN